MPSLEVAQTIFEAPYEYNSALELVPLLASDLPTVEQNGKRWIVPLNPDATFQNGDPVTAEDVVYSYTAPLEEETENAGEVSMIAEATPVDQQTVQFDLKYEFGAFKHYLNRAVVPKAVREKDPEAFNKESPLGSGPFRFQSGTQGESAVVTRWDDYWGDPMPKLSQVTFVPVTEGTTRVTTLNTGENDVIKSIPPNSWETVQSMSSANIEDVLGVSYFYIGFNCNEGPTADPQVREAIDYAVSMDQAVSRFIEPAGERVTSPIPLELAEKWEFPVEEWQDIGHDKDIDQAKSMLDDADAVPDDWEATLIVPPDDKRENIAVSVSNGIQEAGYSASVQRLDWPTFIEQYNTGKAADYNMFALGWSGAPDPDSFMYFLFAHEMIGTNNGTYYRNESMNQAIVEARQSTDRAERKPRYEQAVSMVLEDRVHLPAYTLKNSFGVRSRVQDWLAHPIAQFKLASAENNVSIQ